VWTRRTLLDDACPECKGAVKDITDTPNGKKFLSIIIPAEEVRAMNKKTLYATGPSSLLSQENI
jgi:hypothetical protein